MFCFNYLLQFFKDDSNKKDFVADDIEQCVGSTEDEFTDVIQYIREREILYGKNSLLAVYGPMVTYVCAHNKKFNVCNSF